LWVFLIPSVKGYNRFTVELGWSTLGRYPELSARPAPAWPGTDRAEFDLPEYVCRLVSLYARADPWWSYEPPPGEPVPYLEAFAAQAGGARRGAGTRVPS
jgi:hypothetical protein